jgi:hypothetical protein
MAHATQSSTTRRLAVRAGRLRGQPVRKAIVHINRKMIEFVQSDPLQQFLHVLYLFIH